MIRHNIIGQGNITRTAKWVVNNCNKKPHSSLGATSHGDNIEAERRAVSERTSLSFDAGEQVRACGALCAGEARLRGGLSRMAVGLRGQYVRGTRRQRVYFRRQHVGRSRLRGVLVCSGDSRTACHAWQLRHDTVIVTAVPLDRHGSAGRLSALAECRRGRQTRLTSVVR